MSSHHGSLEDEIVYVPGQHKSGGCVRFHTDPECPHLLKANSVNKHPRSSVEANKQECKFCRGEGGYGNKPTFDHFNALKEGAE